MEQLDFLPLLLNERSDERIVHMCLNADCFYCETILDFHDLVWKDVWSSELEELTPIPYCPACHTVVWRERE